MRDEGVPHNLGVAEAQERVALRQAADREDVADVAVARDALLSEFGVADFTTGREVLREHIAGLSPREREAILTGTTKEGTAMLNDPASIKVLLRRAIGPISENPEEMDAELAELRKLMPDRASSYWKGPGSALKQLRYRLLVQARGLARGFGEQSGNG